MHVLPDLEAIDEQFGDKINVIRNHSAKFDNEKSAENILSAIQKYGIRHAVINDEDCQLWRMCSIKCWPTIAVFGPGLRPLVVCSGEGHRQFLIDSIALALEIYQTPRNPGSRIERPLEKRLDRLSYPGKVTCGVSDDQYLIISDTGNHRIVIADREGKIKRVIGTGERGFHDGDSSVVQFNQPQGVTTLPDGRIVVADTGNHRLRMIDLSGEVTTLVGTGEQGRDVIGGKDGVEQPIASPWDVVTYKTREELDAPNVLLVAMAGTHQIWGYFLEDTIWWKNRLFKKGSAAALVGSGEEENRNNSYPHKVGLAQPSGLSVKYEEKALYVADSESSSIRRISLVDGSCKGVCGGERDPTNLFAFGDIDGPCIMARLQHPLAVISLGSDLLVADSYSHKIKRISKPFAKDSKCVSITGQSADGTSANLQMREPGGLCVDSTKQYLYVADTNNSRILNLDLFAQTAENVRFEFPPQEPLSDSFQVLTISPTGGTIKIIVSLKLCKGVKLNKEAESEWNFTTSPVFSVKNKQLLDGSCARNSRPAILSVSCNNFHCLEDENLQIMEWNSNQTHFSTQLSIFTNQRVQFGIKKSVVGCTNDLCFMREVELKFRVQFEENAKSFVEFERVVEIE